MSALAQLMAFQTRALLDCNFIPSVLPPYAFLVFVFLPRPLLIHGRCLVGNVLWQHFLRVDGDKSKTNLFFPLSELAISSFRHTPCF